MTRRFILQVVSSPFRIGAEITSELAGGGQVTGRIERVSDLDIDSPCAYIKVRSDWSLWVSLLPVDLSPCNPCAECGAEVHDERRRLCADCAEFHWRPFT